MKTDLSSKIKLEYIPEKYFNPKGEVELASLTRKEKVYTKIYETAADGSEYLAEKIVKYINKSIESKGHCNIALDSAKGLDGTFKRLIQYNIDGLVDFSNVTIFSLC